MLFFYDIALKNLSIKVLKQVLQEIICDDQTINKFLLKASLIKPLFVKSLFQEAVFEKLYQIGFSPT